MRGRRLTAVFCLFAGVAQAATLELPRNATLIGETREPDSFYELPLAAWTGTELPKRRITGLKERQLWRIGTPGLTTAQALAPLLEQLEADGFEIVLNCSTRTCGGFDYRFHTEITRDPDFRVNLGDFRAVSAISDTGDAINLFASRTRSAVDVQVTSISPNNHSTEIAQNAAQARPAIVASAATPLPKPEEIAQALFAQGHAVLVGVEFASGASTLETASLPALEALATFMRENPGARIAIVGHTDSQGGLDGNIVLSRARARAVREALISTYGMAPERLEGEGMGYLAPIASNLTEEGRAQNRRVEAIVLSVE